MTTEFDDSQHWGIFTTGATLTSSTGKMVRQSELVLSALRSQGVFDTMVDDTSAPAHDKLWLDKNTDPAILKEWDSVASAWVEMTFDRLFGRAVITALTVSGGTGDAIEVDAPAAFISNRLYSIVPTADNTGATTIQVAGIGTYDVVYGDGSDLVAGELIAGGNKVLLFTDGQFEVLSSATMPGAGTVTVTSLAVSDSDRLAMLQHLTRNGAGDGQTQAADLLNTSAANASFRNQFKVPAYCNDRDELKALDTTKDLYAYLGESGRQGTFQWKSGDFSTLVTADTEEGIYVKATAVDSDTGAWVRDYKHSIHVEWFGYIADADVTDGTGSDNTDAVQGAFDTAIAIGGTSLAYFPEVLFPRGFGLITGEVTVSKIVRIRGTGGAMQSGLLVRLTSPDGSTPGIDFQSGAYINDFIIRGRVTGDTNVFVADSVGINGGSNLICTNVTIDGFAKGVTRSGGFYHKFTKCTFQNCQAIFPGWNANNVSFIECKANAFDDLFTYSGGQGPVRWIGGSIESWCGTLFKGTSGAAAHIALIGAYVENYPGTDAAAGLASTKYSTGVGFVSMESLTQIGCQINLKGVTRWYNGSSATLQTLVSKGNRLIVDDTSPNDTTTYVYIASNFNSVDCQDYFDGTFGGTAYISGNYPNPEACRIIDPATFADISPSVAWTAATLQNSWADGSGLNYNAAAYRKLGSNTVELRGIVNGSGASSAVIMTLPTGYRPAKRATRVTATIGATPTVVALYVATNGTVTIANTTYTVDAISLDGFRFQLT